MNLPALLSRLRNLDVKLWVEGDEPRLSVSEDTLAPELRDAFRARRDELVRFLREASRSVIAPGAGIQPARRDRPLPLSFAQQRFWFLMQLEQDSAAYNLLYVLRLRGRLD